MGWGVPDLGGLASGLNQFMKDEMQPGGIVKASIDKAGKNNSSSSSSSSSTSTGDTNPVFTEIKGDAAAGNTGMNPLAVNAFYAQAVAPLLQQLVGGNPLATQVAQASTPYANKIPQGFQGILNAENAATQANQDTTNRDLTAAALNAPAITNLMNQMGKIQSQDLRNYAKIILQGGDPLAGISGP